jgi:UDP-N-acetylmuramoyl-tripeptide--D-alanyl-D-alanine ligase
MTRIAPVHLEFFADEEAIAREKAVLPASTPEDGAVFFAVDEPWSDILRAAAPGRLVTMALECPAEIRGVRDAADPRRLRVEGPDGFRVDCRLPLPGEPALRNALRAAAVGCAAGLDGAVVSGALETVRPPPMRGGEQSIGGVAWINDAYNSSPVSLAAALDTFASHAAARKWIVLGGMWELGERSDALHREAGRRASGGPWAGLIAVGARAAAMADGAVEAGWPADRLWRCDDAAGAVDVLRDRLSPGDAVLLKGSRGERMEQVMALWTDARRPAADPTTD